MKLRGYVYLWLGFILVLTYEYLMLNQKPTEGLFGLLKQTYPYFKDLKLTTEGGRQISLYFGWSGLALILTTNLYVMRKRLGFLTNVGRISGWLEFHIFCGLMGPTLIVFHSNFKVRGLVAISFWSMIIVAVSGIVGRYFYIQVSQMRAELAKEALGYEKVLAEYQKASGPRIQQFEWDEAKFYALRLVGGDILAEPTVGIGFISAIVSSMMGDFRMKFSSPPIKPGMPETTKGVLTRFALAKRRVLFFDVFRQYLGYWHSFHMPFSYFMYSIAVIHVAVALLLGAKR